MRQAALLLLLTFMLSVAGWSAWMQTTANRGWKTVEQTLGYPGQPIGEGFRVDIPRTDLNVLVHGAWLDPHAGLSSWFAFAPQPQDCLLIGELTVVDAEVGPLEAQLTAQGLTLLSLYRPFTGETPGVERLRFWGQGRRVTLAQKARALLTATGMPLSNPVPSPAAATWGVSLEKLLGPGTRQGAVLRFDPMPAGPVTENGLTVPSYMGGQTTWFFQSEGKETQVYGQWVVPVEKAGLLMENLSQEHLPVTGTHSDLCPQTPSQATINFWVQGDADKIAKSLKRILQKTTR